MHNFHVFQRANSPNYWVQWPKVTLFLSRNHCWLRPQAGKHDVLGPAVISLDISAGLQQLAVRKGPILCRFQSSSWAPWLSLVCSQCSYVVDSHHSHDQLILNIFDPMIAITISADKQTFVAEEHSCHLNVSVEHLLWWTIPPCTPQDPWSAPGNTHWTGTTWASPAPFSLAIRSIKCLWPAKWINNKCVVKWKW